MRVHKSSILIIMLFLFILALLHLSSYRHISRGGKEERTRTRTRTRFLYSFPHDFGTTNHHAAEIKDNKVSEFHPVSRATTPGGPNPLHN
ncbi:hypothetical protein Lalb_Chr03g0034451 [Lupinus albus]|uniref:Uncharacterized protein n=1 Tax=Lupinus albus TaxID=3870 RepID=A0A6A4QV90_LUPAL|nr:hypothetical protein Lalb_Chr03g0034451 [Lupinus albus]